MLLRKIYRLSPLIILWGFSGYMLYRVWRGDILLREEHYNHFAILILSTLSYALRRKSAYLLTGLLLFCGMVTKASFTPSVESFYVKFNDSHLFNISWPYMYVFMLYLYVYRKELSVQIKYLVQKEER